MSEPAWKQRDPFAVSEQDANYREGMQRMASEQALPPPRPMSNLTKGFVTFLLLWFLAAFGVYKLAETIAIGILTATPDLDASVQARVTLWPQITGGLFSLLMFAFGALLVLRALSRRRARTQRGSFGARLVRYGVVYLLGGLLAGGLAAVFVATAVLPT